MSESASTTERLERLLGFDPAKSNATTSSVVTAAIREIQGERSAEVQARVKTLLSEAIDLRKKQAETKKKFETEDAKFDKSLGKLLNRIEQMANNEMVTPAEDEDAEEAVPQSSLSAKPQSSPSAEPQSSSASTCQEQE